MEDNKLKENIGNVKEINITSEMKTSFLNYAMSVIVSRALPDIRDGLKPVQRRILYAMNDLGMTADKPHKKSARIVGEVIGKYHPHGDLSVYEAMVRMAQPFSYMDPLIDGHGNFGSIDGDGAAAMRYTEARMSKIAGELVRDLGKNTVDFVPNYDEAEMEPSVLPSRFPNLLVNGAMGIAVGMATKIAPHNLGEVIDGLLAYMDNPDIEILELMDYIKGPDFPTGGSVLGLTGLRNAYQTGNGGVLMRAKTEIVEGRNRSQIIVTEIPYAVNKTKIIDKIAELARDKRIEGITDLRDESNRNGIRIVIELRRDVNPYVMLNNLYKYTDLQSSFNFNMVALVKGQPMTVNLKDILANYLEHQVEVIQRRTLFDLERAEARAHILEGLIIALNDIDKAIEIIKKSATAQDAREGLMDYYELTEIQARAILDMRLQRLTSLEIDRIVEEAAELAEKIKEYKSIIESHDKKLDIIREEITEIKDKYATPRRTVIDLHSDLTIENEDLIPVEDVIITVTNNGYIKRMNLDVYRAQNRGGIGMTGIRVHSDDYVEHMIMTSTHDYQLIFTNKGRVYKRKGYKIPEYSRTAQGMPIVQYIDFQEGETLTSITSIEDFDSEDNYLTFVTKNGIIKRTPVSDYKNIRQNGIIALNLRDDDELVSVRVTDGKQDIIIGSSDGKAIRFAETDVRSMGRTATGVRGMNLDKGQEVVGVAVISDDEQEVFVITENGYGKRTLVSEYRRQNRGGKGVKTINITDRNGPLKTLRAVEEDQDIIVVTNRGIVIRTYMDQIARTGRATQGVRVIRLRADQQVSTVALVPKEDEEVEEISDNGVTIVQESLLENDVNG